MPDQPLPDILYHYTTQDALLSIFNGEKLDDEQRQVLWATKIQYMNDASELTAPLKMAGELLRQKQKELGRDPLNEAQRALRQRVRCMRKEIEGIANINIGVIAFSTHKDRLSQWRAYSQKGPGYAIGFDPRKLVPETHGHKLRLAACEYVDKKQQRAKIRTLIAKCVVPTSDLAFFNQIPFGLRLLTMASTMKDVAFKEEGEWRIVPSEVRQATDLIDFAYWMCGFRSGKSTIVPYWRVPLDVSAVKEVWIGPTPHPELAREAVRGLLHKCIGDLTMGVCVENSRIPYRNW